MIVKIKPIPYAMPGETVSEEEQGWAVYIGEPENFHWLADFKNKKNAEYFAYWVAEDEHTVEYPE